MSDTYPSRIQRQPHLQGKLPHLDTLDVEVGRHACRQGLN